MKLTKENILSIPNEPGIYLITNTVNNKHYVGQAINLRKRLSSHLHTIINKTSLQHILLYRAVEKHGIDNFKFEIIETIELTSKEETKKILDELEIRYIEEYDSYNNGYNQTKGGDGGILGYKMTPEQVEKIKINSKRIACDGRYKVYCLNIHTLEVIESVNLSELSKILNIKESSVRSSKCHKRILYNTYYFSNSEDIIEEFNEFKRGRKIVIQDESYLIDYYNYLIGLNRTVSINEIAESLNLSKEAISKRNRKLRDMGYKLPINSHAKIAYVEVLNVNTKELEKLSIAEIALKFGISTTTARKYAKADTIYKETYSFKVIYDD